MDKTENKMKNVIQITDKILGVIVPSDAYDFEFIHNKTRVGYKIDHRLSYIDLPKGNFKIHGTCTLPAFDFDFEVTDKMASCNSSCSQSDYHKGGYCDRNGCYGKDKNGMFANKIQKAIQDEGMFVVNPVKLMDGKNISCEEEAEAYHKNMTAFIEAETKTVKKLLLIEKI
jgi:hypothetical protein